MPQKSKLVLLTITFQWTLLSSLKMIDITIPDEVVAGDSAILSCRYMLSPGQHIDSVKWYRNGSEIYRIVPASLNLEDRIVTFSSPGLHLDKSRSGLLKSGTHQIQLNNITKGAQGKYVCQVTESRPPFHTAELSGYLYVLVLPTHGPVLSGLKEEYIAGEELKVECRTGPSDPPCNVTWYLNAQKMPKTFVTTKEVDPSMLDYTGGSGGSGGSGALYRSVVSQLRVPLSSSVVRLSSGPLSVRCSASMGRTYSESAEGVAMLATPTMVLHHDSVPLTSQSQHWPPCLVTTIFITIVLKCICF